ncbi:fibronectin-like [Lingula anatina]|uniref:Fibronectin-like n=1 Tax=Lingula anatina TaxID=7574 RepID=A0A1S3IN54_LINAN|nr:fibronectin-like [Lingula anatina]|eukprot:XP_013399670.1 fibronectin-like [Lingula anatina]
MCYWPSGKSYSSRSKETRETLMVLSDLDPGTSYEAHITTVSNRRTSEPYHIAFATDPDIPLDLAAACRGSTLVDVKWKKPRGLFDHFTVGWRLQDEEVKYKTRDTTKTDHTIAGLSPGTQYEISVSSVSNRKESEPCSIVVQTDPASITAIHIDTGVDSITLKWKRPEGKVDGYQLQLNGPKDPQEGKTFHVGETEEGEIHVAELTPGTTYFAKLLTTLNDQRSKPYCFKCSTKPAKCEPKCQSKGTDYLTIKWEAAIGEVGYYGVDLIEKAGSVRSKKIPRDSNTEATFDDLLPGTEYDVIIHTVTDSADTQSDPLRVCAGIFIKCYFMLPSKITTTFDH